MNHRNYSKYSTHIDIQVHGDIHRYIDICLYKCGVGNNEYAMVNNVVEKEENK